MKIPDANAFTAMLCGVGHGLISPIFITPSDSLPLVAAVALITSVFIVPLIFLVFGAQYLRNARILERGSSAHWHEIRRTLPRGVIWLVSTFAGGGLSHVVGKLT